MIKKISINTQKREEMIDISELIKEFLSELDDRNGMLHMFLPHASAALVINENADPNICLDTLDALSKIAPRGKWRHDALDGNADSHIKASIIGCSRFIPIIDGEMQLGRWQTPMLVELDGPRTRNLIFQFIHD